VVETFRYKTDHSAPILADPLELKSYDGIIFGTPTRFGNMAAQMKNFIDQTGPLWREGALAGKVGGVFTSSASQHGGQETTITSFHIVLLHHGMLIAGMPPSFQGMNRMDEITGGSHYGASTLSAPDGRRFPSDNELAGARAQGRSIASIAKKLKG
jgi:NAD(P)H dehydrogenase (quinone)